MELNLDARMRKFIEAKVETGEFQSPEEVVSTALALLMHEDRHEFEPGELARLVAEGEADVARGDVLDGEEVFEKLRRKSAEFRRRMSVKSK